MRARVRLKRRITGSDLIGEPHDGEKHANGFITIAEERARLSKVRRRRAAGMQSSGVRIGGQTLLDDR